MNPTQKEFLVSLINELGPSGHEFNVQKLWKNEVSKFCKNINVDPHGNLTATLNPEKEFSVMIVGHADEIGLIVNYIDDKGFLYFMNIGGVDQTILSAHKARIMTKNGIVEGIFGQKSLHHEDSHNRKLPKRHEVYIDIGAKDKKEAEKLITIGDPVIYGENYIDLQGKNAAARCFDNRIGIYLVAEIMRKLSTKKFNTKVYGVSSVQEETGVWGAGNAAYNLKPDIGIAFDVCPSTDIPGTSKEQFGDLRLGAGPIIRRGVIAHHKISDLLIQTAKKKKIKIQIDVENGRFGTDSDPISKSRGGVAVGGVEIPTRYLHSSAEVLNHDDVDNCIELVTEFILSLEKNKDFLKYDL
ncbi:M42 family metallopeptidase [soil metagenome]